MTVPELRNLDEPLRFDVFLSYATKPDYRFARQLEAFLESFHRLRIPGHPPLPPIRACRDGSDFRLIGDLKDTLVAHLRQCRYLLVLACTESAQSPNVDFELAWFLQHRGSASVLVAVTSGSDPQKCPEEVFSPRMIAVGLHLRPWYDFRGRSRFKITGATKVRDYHDARLALVAHLLGRAPEEILPIWQRERSRARRRATWILLLFSAAVIVTIGVIELRRRTIAQKARWDHLISMARGDPDPLISTLLLRELPASPELPGALATFHDKLAEDVPSSVFKFVGPIVSLSFSADGNSLVVLADKKVATVPTNGRANPTFLLHSAPFAAAKFSPSDDCILTRDENGRLELWNAAGHLLAALSTDRIRVVDAGFSPDGQHVAAGLEDGRVVLWSSHAGAFESPTVLGQHVGAITRLRWSSTGQYIFTASKDLTGRLWDLSAGVSKTVLRAGPIFDVAFNYQDTLFVTVEYGAQAELARVSHPNEPAPLGKPGNIGVATFDPESDRMVTLSPWEDPSLWELQAGGGGYRLGLLAGHTGVVRSICLGSHGAIITGGDDGMLIIRKIGKGRHEFRKHMRGKPGAEIDDLTLSRDESMIASGAGDGSVEIWGLDKQLGHLLIEGPTRVHIDKPMRVDLMGPLDLTTSIDSHGERVLLVAGGQAVMWTRSDGKRHALPADGTVRAARLSHDGKRLLIVADVRSVLFDLATGDAIAAVLHDHTPTGGDLASDGQHFAIATADHVDIYAAPSDKIVTTLRHVESIEETRFAPIGLGILVRSKAHVSVWNIDKAGEPLVRVDGGAKLAAYSPDGARVLIIGDNGVVELFAVATGQATRLDEASAVRDAIFSRSGSKLLVIGTNGASVWSGDGRRKLRHENVSDLRRGVLSPDGQRMVLLDRRTTDLRIWETDGTSDPIVYKGHTGAVIDATFSADSTRVVSSAEDGTIRVWLSSGGEPAVYKVDTRADHLRLTADDQYLLAEQIGAADVILVGWAAARQGLFDRTTACLGRVDRVQLLGETDAEATRRWGECEKRYGR